ncbi:hypothetical protein SODG_001279 [Sodalis praecaptivus]|uniref:hypothetical protein n=1 Tax=Sodalis praecaptivus TaxID=1239307 RepID=UPI0027E806FF|nr:hypothetical protein [Sodalis praecaptivus]CAJ0996944.1 hypothetical protein NVIRENTERO_02633 [Sodalis praecaptivus]
MLGGNLTPFVPVACTGPVRYVGLPQLQRDIDNLKLALTTTACQGAFYLRWRRPAWAAMNFTAVKKST